MVKEFKNHPSLFFFFFWYPNVFVVSVILAEVIVAVLVVWLSTVAIS